MPSESSMSSDLAEAISQTLSEADAEFVQRCAERMEKGAEKYGPLKFMEVDTVEEAMQEAIDLSNYARFIYIKLYLLQKSTARLANKNPIADKQGFIPMKGLFGLESDT